MNRCILSLALGLVAGSALLNIADAKAAGAQLVEPLPVEDALSMEKFGEGVPIALSPKGHWLAYVTQDYQRAKPMDTEMYPQTGVPFWGTGTDIWVLNLGTGEKKNLTKGVGDNWLPAWSPDDQHLAFLSDRGDSGHARLWVFDVESGELRRVSKIEVHSHEIEWLADGHRLLVTTLPGGVAAEQGPRVPLPHAQQENHDDRDVPGSTATYYKSNADSDGEKDAAKSDPWDLNEDLRDLVGVDVASGSATAIVRHKKISWYSLSPDGHRVAYTTPQRFEKPGSQQIVFDLTSVDLTTTRDRVLASGIRLDYDGAAFSWSPDSQSIGFHAGGMDERNYDCYVVAITDGIPRNISNLPALQSAARHKSEAPLWDRASKAVYFIREGALWQASSTGNGAERLSSVPNRQIMQIISSAGTLAWTPGETKSIVVLTHDDREKQDGIYKIDLSNGRGIKLLEKGQCYTCANSFRTFTVTDDGQRALYFAEDAQHDNSLWISDATFQNPARLVELNERLDGYKIGAVRLLHWLSDDGEPLQGALLLPADYQEGLRYPLIVWVYGGSLLSNNFDHFGLVAWGPFNMQLLATRGYAVLLPDAPLHMGTPMLDLAKTVLPGVNKVIEMGVADPNRLGIMGHSYGGYSTLALIVQTKRFAAAIEVSGFGSLLGMYGEMNRNGKTFGIPVVELGQGLMGGTPWQFRSSYIENSPIFDLDRVETPLLIVHGSNDIFVPSFLADEVFVGLRRLGKKVEYAKYEGEAHSPLDWRHEDQIDFCNRMIAWFDLHLKCRQCAGVASVKKLAQ